MTLNKHGRQKKSSHLVTKDANSIRDTNSIKDANLTSGNANQDGVPGRKEKKRQRKMRQNLMKFYRQNYLIHESIVKKTLTLLKEQKKKSKELDERLDNLEDAICKLEVQLQNLNTENC